jgi:hypothetical protein
LGASLYKIFFIAILIAAPIYVRAAEPASNPKDMDLYDLELSLAEKSLNIVNINIARAILQDLSGKYSEQSKICEKAKEYKSKADTELESFNTMPTQMIDSPKYKADYIDRYRALKKKADAMTAGLDSCNGHAIGSAPSEATSSSAPSIADIIK